jgi:hypothetical protein
VELSGYALLPDGSTFEVALADLSYEGCKIRTATPLAPGDRLKLSVFHRGLIQAEVRWFEDGLAGLVFSTYEVPTRQHWPRRSERVAVSADVALRKPGQPNYRVRVFDASPQGCKLEFIERPQEGDRLWVKFDGIEALEAEVCWVEDFVMGVNFAKSLHPAVFDLLVTRMNQDGA